MGKQNYIMGDEDMLPSGNERKIARAREIYERMKRKTKQSDNNKRKGKK